MLAAWGILSAAMLAPLPEPVVLIEGQGREDRTSKGLQRLVELAAREIDSSLRRAAASSPEHSVAGLKRQEILALAGQAPGPAFEALSGFVSIFSLSPMQEGEVHRVVIACGPSLDAEAAQSRETARSAAAAFSRGF
jgi:hypothetical protein